MGQKVNPHGLRVGVIKEWDSKWYAEDADFSEFKNGLMEAFARKTRAEKRKKRFLEMQASSEYDNRGECAV